MIISTAAAKAEIEALAGWTDEKVTRKLQAVEQAIRAYTNNNFQARAFRVVADIRDGAAIFAASDITAATRNLRSLTEETLSK